VFLTFVVVENYPVQTCSPERTPDTMHQIKLFKGLETDLPGLEKEMNEWLAKSGARVINMFGNLAPQKDETQPDDTGVAHSLYLPSNIFIAVLYEKSEKPSK